MHSPLAASAPPVRRWFAGSGGRPAMPRRSETDRESGLGKPRGMPCYEGDHVAAEAATPPEGDTLALVPSGPTRRPGGVATGPEVRPATWLPHHAPSGVLTAERSHATAEQAVAGLPCF